MNNFKDIIDQHHPIIFKIGKSYTDNDADFQDLYQEILIQIWKALSSFEGKSKLSTFIYRITMNTALVFRRNEQRRVKKLEDTMHNLKHQAELQSEGEQSSYPETPSLFKAIRALKKDDRALIILHLEQKSYEEIGEILGITKINVGVKINRIKKKLYDIFNDLGHE